MIPLEDPIPFDELPEFFNHPGDGERAMVSVGGLPVKKKVLLISSANPYPVVKNGCERLVLDYELKVFSNYEVHFVATRPGSWDVAGWFYGGVRLDWCNIDRLLALDFAFAFFVGFQSSDFAMKVAVNMPSFCLTDTHPHPNVPEGIFRGILSHHAAGTRRDVLLCGGSYNSEIFYKNRTAEDVIVSVGRIHPDKYQADLVQDYRRRIYDRCGLPLHLVGGVDDFGYYREVCPYIDGVSILSTIEAKRPDAMENWRSPAEIAALLNRARFFVTASPNESFGIALAEAMACGTTCVLNGNFPGFNCAELRPRVFGNVTGRRGSILDVLQEAVAADARRDGSEWIRKYSIERSAERQLEFIERRLREA